MKNSIKKLNNIQESDTGLLNLGPLFLESEKEIAATIIQALDGLSIIAAQCVLKKVENALLQSKISFPSQED